MFKRSTIYTHSCEKCGGAFNSPERQPLEGMFCPL